MTVTHTAVCLESQRTPSHCHDSAKDGGSEACRAPLPGPGSLPEAPAGSSSWDQAVTVTGDWETRLAGWAPDGGKGRGRGHRGPGAAEGDGLKSMMHVCDSGWSRGGNRDRGGKRGWAGISWPPDTWGRRLCILVFTAVGAEQAPRVPPGLQRDLSPRLLLGVWA